MQIFLILAVLAGAVLLTLGAGFVGSLIFGGILLTMKRARVVVPVFFLIFPATLLGSLAGGVIIGYSSIRADDHLVFLGPLGGLIAGGVAGLSLGVVGASLWWWRMSRAQGMNREASQEHIDAA